MNPSDMWVAIQHCDDRDANLKGMKTWALNTERHLREGLDD